MKNLPHHWIHTRIHRLCNFLKLKDHIYTNSSLQYGQQEVKREYDSITLEFPTGIKCSLRFTFFFAVVGDPRLPLASSYKPSFIYLGVGE